MLVESKYNKYLFLAITVDILVKRVPKTLTSELTDNQKHSHIRNLNKNIKKYW